MFNYYSPKEHLILKVQVTRFSRKSLFLHQNEEYSVLNRFVCFHWLEKVKERKEDNFKVYKQKPLNTIFISCSLVVGFVFFWSMFCSAVLKDVEWGGGRGVTTEIYQQATKFSWISDEWWSLRQLLPTNQWIINGFGKKWGNWHPYAPYFGTPLTLCSLQIS